jgi:hypothetical protein
MDSEDNSYYAEVPKLSSKLIHASHLFSFAAKSDRCTHGGWSLFRVHMRYPQNALTRVFPAPTLQRLSRLTFAVTSQVCLLESGDARLPFKEQYRILSNPAYCDFLIVVYGGLRIHPSSFPSLKHG